MKRKNTIMKKTILLAMLSWFTCSSNDDVIFHFKGVEFRSLELISGDLSTITQIKRTEQPSMALYYTDIEPHLSFGEPRLQIRFETLEDIEETGCSKGHTNFIIKPFDNNQLITDAGFSWSGAGFKINFNDTTYSTAETHEYRLEFYECEGDCDFNEYSKAKDKFGEITVTLNYTP